MAGHVFKAECKQSGKTGKWEVVIKEGNTTLETHKDLEDINISKTVDKLVADYKRAGNEVNITGL